MDFDVNRYGFPGDDGQLCKSVTELIAHVLGLNDFSWFGSMEQGAQLEDSFALEAGADWIRHLSHYEWKVIRDAKASPDVKSVIHYNR